MKFAATLIFGVGALSWSVLAGAADKLSFGPAPAWVVPQEAGSVPASAASADVGFMLEDRQVRLSGSATKIYVNSVGRIQSPQGLTAFGNLSLSWNPDTMSVTVHKLQIRRGDHATDVLATQQFTVLRREQNLEYAVINGVLTATMQLAGLQVGDVLQLSYTISYADPILAGSAQWLLGGWAELPIGHLHARASWDSSEPIRWKASDSISAIREHRSGTTSDVSLDLHDVQPLVQPKGAPHRFVQLREIELTSYQSWADIARRLAPLYARASTLPASSPLQAEIARIRSTHPDPVARAEAALALVQDQVRYLFLGMNDGGLVPADATETWSRRFGDCKAKTTLLLALLHGLGIEAEPVAVSTVRGDGLNQKLPMVLWFNHVFVRATIAGRTYWLDGSRSGDRRLANIPDPAYHWGLPLVASGSELIPIPLDAFDRPDAEEVIRIDASAGLDAPAPFHVEMTMRGDSALQVNRSLANATASEQDRRIRDYWKKQFDFVDIISVTSAFDEQAAQETWSMEGKAHMDWNGDTYETDGLGLGYKADFSRSAGPMQDAPYAVTFPSYSRTTETVLLPHSGTGFSVEGSDINRTVGGVEYRRHSALHGNQFSAEAVSRALAPEFPYAEAAGAQAALRDMDKQTLRIRAPADRAAPPTQPAAASAPAPMSSSDYVRRAWNDWHEGAYANMISDADEALKLNPKNDDALAVRGLAKVLLGDYPGARKDIDAARALNATSAPAFAALGALEQTTGHPQKAVVALSEAIKLRPTEPLFLSWRAMVYAGIHEHELALADSAASLRMRPDNQQMHVLRAQVLLAEGAIDQAVTEADTAVALDTGYTSALLSVGLVYEGANKRDKAMAIANRLLEHSPSAPAYLLHARLRPRADLTGRRTDIDAALKLNPNSIDALGDMAGLLFASGQYAEEIGTLSNLLSLSKSDHVALLAQRAVAYNKTGKSELARKDLDSAQHAATSADNYNEICWTLAAGDMALNSALAACDKAVALAPNDGAVTDSRAMVLLRLARYGEAITQYDQALAQKPGQAASLYGRGIAKRRSGELESGDRDLEAARQQDADVAAEFAEYGLRP